MSHKLLTDSRVFEFILRIDADTVATVATNGHRKCGGRLDRADYPRKPRGVPGEFENTTGRRHKSTLGEPLPELCVRPVDDARVSGYAVLSICRLRTDSLSKSTARADDARSSEQEVQRVWLRDAPGQDTHRVLQGFASKNEI